MKQAAKANRYVSPKRTFFVQYDGPYRRCHLFDTVLERDVEFCEEYAHFADDYQFRQEVLLEAKVGALGHPHLVPTFDLGFGEKGLFFFTRHLLRGQGLQRLIHNCFRSAGEHELYESLAGLDDTLFSPELLARQLQFVADDLCRVESLGVVVESRRLQRSFAEALRLPEVAVREKIARTQTEDLQRVDALVQRGLLEPDEAERKRNLAAAQAFHELVSTTRRASQIDVERIAYNEGLVTLSLSWLVEMLIEACRAVEFVHQRGIWHLHLYPDAVLAGPARNELFVTEWRQAHVVEKGPPRVNVGVPRSDRDTWNCTPPEFGSSGIPVGPAFDVFALGGILSFVLHEMWPGESEPKRRPIFFPRDEVARAGVNELMDALETVWRRAQAPNPVDRWQTVGALADALEECLREAQAAGMR